jgi:transglutaminase-like putative cysteine protease
MSHRRRPAGNEVALAVLTAATTFFTLLSWQVLAEDSSAFLLPLFWFCAGVAAAGLASRSLSTPRLLVPVVQLGGVALVLNHWWAPLGPLGGWVPTPTSVAQVVTVLERAVTEAGRYPAPVPADAVAFWPVMVAVGCLLILAVELLACTLRRIPLAGLPLLAGFTAPVSIVGGVPWLTFALAATAFVFLLTAEQAGRLGQWGRSLTGSGTAVRDNQPHDVRLSTLWPTSARIGLAGVGLAVLAPLVVPTTDGLFDGSGGSGDGDNEVTISDPLVDMRRQLNRGDDVPLIRVETDDPAPSYLRTSVLDEFDGTSWSPSQRDIPPMNRVAGEMPPVPGLSPDTPRVQYESAISISDELDSTWLPAPYPVTEVDVPGDWRFDSRTLDLISFGGLDTRGLSYDVAGLALDPDPEALVAAAPAPRSVFLDGTALPDTLPAEIAQLADQVTADGNSAFERAVLLQQWFRQDGGFRYSLDEAPGSSVEQLELFLGTGPGSRVGYCEQFAAAMAMMARSEGIPARVAVGFLRPDPQPDGSWVYSSYDLHSWPELYFEGAGWIRFEPTPPDRTADAIPTYTAGDVPQPDLGPTPSISATPQDERPARQREESAASASSTTGDSSPTHWAGVLGTVLLVLAAALAPWAMRNLARRRRYAGGDARGLAEGAWGEVRATAIDLRRSWADGTTTRQQAYRLVPAMGAASLLPLEALALLVERARYSRSGLAAEESDRAQKLAEEVTVAMLKAATPRSRRRAVWLPRSLWRGRSQDARRDRRRVTAPGANDLERERVSL